MTSILTTPLCERCRVHMRWRVGGWLCHVCGHYDPDDHDVVTITPDPRLL